MQPTRLGPYAIRTRLGRGGMGAVYEAEDTATGAVVAVKTLATHLVDDDGLRKRFQSEIEALKTLRHPGIVRLLAFGEDEGEPYFVMELVRGRSLEQLLRAGRRFTWPETVAIAAEIARALKAAHDHGVVHRDLKPANLLFVDAVESAGSPRVKLADFGIARLFGDPGHTAVGTLVGTAEYMAPEQATGGPVDPRADLYALGLVMFAMLAGKPPFHGGTAAELLERHRHEPPPRVAASVPDVPPALDALIDRLLSKDPGRRPASALALGRLLAAVEEVGASTTTPQPVAAPATAVETRSLPVSIAADPPRHVDLFTETWAMAAAPMRRPPPGAATAVGIGQQATSGSSLPTASLPTASLPTAPLTAVPPTPDHRESAAARTRHTTVAELDSAARAQARRRVAWQVVSRSAALLLLAGVVAGWGIFMLRRLEPGDLHEAILATVAGNADRLDGLKDALPDIERFLAWYPADPRAAAIRGLRREIEIDRLATRARLRERKSVPPRLRIEREYRLALALKSSDPAGCVAALEAILAMPRDVLATALEPGDEADELVRDPDLWLALVRQQIHTLQPLGEADARAIRQDADRGRLPTDAGDPGRSKSPTHAGDPAPGTR